MKAISKATDDKSIASLRQLSFAAIISNEIMLIRNKELVTGDIRPIRKLFNETCEFPTSCSMLIGYPVVVSISMIRQTTKTDERIIIENFELILLLSIIRAAKLVSRKHKLVTGAIGIAFLPIPASINASAIQPARAIILTIITTPNAQTEIFP